MTQWMRRRVAVPTVAHAEVGCTLMEMGIDVLVEKPMARTLAEADELIGGGQAVRADFAGRACGAIQSRRCEQWSRW